MRTHDYAAIADQFAPLVAKIYTQTDHDGMAGARCRAMLLVGLTREPDAEFWRPLRIPAAPRTVDQALHGCEAHQLAAAVARMGASSQRALSAHREQVTYLEARNAQRLLVLASNARAAFVDPREAEIAQGIGWFVAEFWGVDLPTNGDLRSWAESRTRQYAALPRAWRYVEMPAVISKKGDDEERS